MIAPSPAEMLTVTQLNGIIKHRLESDVRLSHCRVTGEISNFKHHSSGHMYFTLKDDTSRLRALMFTSRNRSLSFRPSDGMRVVCSGSIGVFDRDGQYQLYVDDMQPDGIGALYTAFVQLKERLQAEGLFDESHKRPLPKFPKVVGVVTSPTGAVIRDICSTLKRRYPMTSVLLAPAQVQGPEAAQTIIQGIRRLTEGDTPLVDVLIVGRGGGSLEELWPFNEEAVARALSECPVPVISAVGHETDFTICDFVADVRAATPTAAAELVAPHVQDLRELLNHLEVRSTNAVLSTMTHQKRRFERCRTSVVFSDPLRLADRLRERLDFYDGQLKERIASPVNINQRKIAALNERLLRLPLERALERHRARVEILSGRATQRTLSKLEGCKSGLLQCAGSLEALNPMAVLSRGYSIVTKKDTGGIVASIQDVTAGDEIEVRLHDGVVSAEIYPQGGSGRGRSIQSRLNI